MWTGLDAPIAAFALFVLNHEQASFFRLHQSFFRTCSYAWSVFAESTSKSKIEQGRHADYADSGAHGISQRFAFLYCARVFADSATSTLAWIDGNEFFLFEFRWWHCLNLTCLSYVSISVCCRVFNRCFFKVCACSLALGKVYAPSINGLTPMAKWYLTIAVACICPSVPNTTVTG